MTGPLHVRLPSGASVAVTDRTVRGARAAIQARTGIRPEDQALVLDGALLTDDAALARAAELGRVPDLVACIGHAHALCRPGVSLPPALQDLERAQPVSAGPTPPSPSPEDLATWPIRFHCVDPVDTRGVRKLARSFHVAYEAHRERRHAELHDHLGALDPGPVVASTCNAGFGDMLRNWVASCEAHGLDPRPRTLIFALDAGARETAKDLGLRCFHDGVSYGEVSERAAGRYGDETFRRCMFAKTAVVMDLLDLGRDVLFQDVDLVWRVDPMPGLVAAAREGGPHIQLMHDGPNPRYQPLHANSGFFHVVASDLTRAAWRRVHEAFAEVLVHRSQQACVNIVLHCLRERGLRVARLPDETHVNGHLVVQAEADGVPLTEAWHVLHMSWTRDVHHKVERFRRQGLWFLDAAARGPAT